MQYLLDLPLRYKFWLVNSVSFFGMLLLVLSAIVDQRADTVTQIRLQEEQGLRLREYVPEQVLLAEGYQLFRDKEGRWTTQGQRLRQLNLGKGFQWVDQVGQSGWMADVFSADEQRYIALQVSASNEIWGRFVPVPTVAQLAWRKALFYASVVFVVMVLVLCASQMLIVFVSSPISILREAMLKVHGKGDLSVRVQSGSQDEVGQMSTAFNLMVKDLSRIVTEIRAATFTMDSMSDHLVSESRNNVQSIENQQAETEQLAAAVMRISSANEDIQRNANDNNQYSLESVAVAQSGNQQVDFMVAAITRLAKDIRSGADVVNKLAEETSSIGTALDVIRAIAEQTNLLALNAAIEAARAGEQGRGFAVVADEVRSLAQRVQDSTDQIKSMLDRLKYSSQEAVDVMNARSDEAGQCVEQAQKAGEVIHAISDHARQINDANNQIANNITEQGDTVTSVNNNVLQLRDEMEAVFTSVKHNAAAARTLAELSSRMMHSIEHFKL